MKKLITTLLTIILACSSAAQDWQNIDLNTHVDILGISFLNRDTGILVASNGFYLSTADGGKSWRSFSSGLDLPLEDVCHVNNDMIFICGANGKIFRTTSGLAGWQDISTGDSTAYLIDIEMMNEKVGLVIGIISEDKNPYGAYALRTTDGGDSWHKLKSLGLGYSELEYDGKGPLYLLGWGKLNYSDDMGRSWRSVFTVEGGTGTAISMHGESGIIVGPQGLCAFTRDGGKTWRLNKRHRSEQYRAVEMIDENTGYVGGDEGIILKTTDGGKSWIREVLPRNFDILEFDIGGDRLYAVGTDGGLVYKEVK